MRSSKSNLCQDANFNSFYLNIVQDISNFAYYKCGDEASAMDLVQEGFAKIWQNCADIDISKAKSYLFTTVNNLFLNTKRHEKVVFNYAKNSPYFDKTNLNPEFLLEEEEFKNKLSAAIATLTEEQREVFLMNRIEEKKYREIAELLGISQKTVEKRMSGAIKVIKDKIGNYKI